jgi:serine/threonine protein kinase
VPSSSQLHRVQAQRERQIHARLRHDNIIQLLASFEDEDNIYFVLEYATGGDLFQLMRQATSNFTEREIVQDVLIPLLEALEYCHQNGIVHRDIKPENLLLTSMGELKLADFGLAIDVKEERPVTRLGEDNQWHAWELCA